MAYSKHRAIRVAVAALLTAGTPLVGGRIFQNREYAMPAGVVSQLHVNYVESTPDELKFGSNGPVDWQTQIEFVVKARGTAGGESAVDLADSIWHDVWSRVMADQTLGSTVGQCAPGSMFVDDDEAEVGVCRLTWRVTYDHRTSNTSLSS